MESKFESLPKNVQKLVKKLANIQRKELKLLQDDTKDDVAEEIVILFEQEDKVIGELFNTKFAIETIGICFPDDDDFLSDDLEGMGEYFLGLYALDRLHAEEESEKYSEDLFYAGATLKRKAEWAAEEEEEYGLDFEDDSDDDDIDDFLDQLFDTFSDLPEESVKKGKKKEGKLVPLFGEKKEKEDKKDKKDKKK